jgi:hypothetical protein
LFVEAFQQTDGNPPSFFDRQKHPEQKKAILIAKPMSDTVGYWINGYELDRKKRKENRQILRM